MRRRGGEQTLVDGADKGVFTHVGVEIDGHALCASVGVDVESLPRVDVVVAEVIAGCRGNFGEKVEQSLFHRIGGGVGYVVPCERALLHVETDVLRSGELFGRDDYFIFALFA